MVPSCLFAPESPSGCSPSPWSCRFRGCGARILESRLERALRVPHVERGGLGGDGVIDLSTGHTVFARNAALPLLPASNESFAITYAALTALGPAFRIETDVLGEGRQDGAVWRGNVVLKATAAAASAPRSSRRSPGRCAHRV